MSAGGKEANDKGLPGVREGVYRQLARRMELQEGRGISLFVDMPAEEEKKEGTGKNGRRG